MDVSDVAVSDVTRHYSGVQTKVFEKLSQWNVPKDQPVAIAFSGGGDSTAVLSLLLKWTEAHTVEGAWVHAFIIDHGLRGGSQEEAKLAQNRARDMGADARILNAQWPDGIPSTGIQEKARNARYGLLAQACDRLNIEGLALFMGHNQDDQVETVLMRQDTGSGWRGLAGIAGHAPFPTQPTLTGVRVLRPMLDCTRSELRAYNRENRLKWIDDPSNENQSFTRIRARKYLALHPKEKTSLMLTASAARETLTLERKSLTAFIGGHTEIYPWGGIALKRSFQTAKLGQSAEALKYIIQAIAGQGTSPSKDKRLQLARRLRARDFKGATLGGVRFFPAQPSKNNGGIFCARDMGALTGRHQIPPLGPLKLDDNEKQVSVKKVWDGRYSITGLNGVTIEALENWRNHLSEAQHEALSYIPKPAQGGLPVFIRDGVIVFIPFLENLKNEPNKTGEYRVKSLTARRLYVLLGEFD